MGTRGGFNESGRMFWAFAYVFIAFYLMVAVLHTFDDCMGRVGARPRPKVRYYVRRR